MFQYFHCNFAWLYLGAHHINARRPKVSRLQRCQKLPIRYRLNHIQLMEINLAVFTDSWLAGLIHIKMIGYDSITAVDRRRCLGNQNICAVKPCLMHNLDILFHNAVLDSMLLQKHHDIRNRQTAPLTGIWIKPNFSIHPHRVNRDQSILMFRQCAL